MIDRRKFMQGAGTLMLGAGLLQHPLARAAASGGGRLLYGYPAGGIGNFLAEGVIPLLAAQDGPAYQLFNVDGRNTRTATLQAKAAPADASTLLQVLSSSFTLQPNIYKKLDFDPVTDFTPIALFGDFPFSLTVGPAVPLQVNSVASFIQWLKEDGNPTNRSIGVSIYGTLGHLALRMIARGSDVPLRGQPYNGSAAMIKDLDNQSIAACFTVAGNGLGKGFGKGSHDHLRSIAVTGRERLKYWPDVPTLYEQGYTDADLTGWFGWFAPAGTPDEVTGPLRARIASVQASAEYQSLHARLLLTQVSLTPEQIRQRIGNERSQYAALLNKYAINQVE